MYKQSGAENSFIGYNHCNASTGSTATPNYHDTGNENEIETDKMVGKKKSIKES
jgi:hypothetical protein